MISTTLLRKAMDDIARNRGEFSLFALLLRTNTLGTSDLVVSAPWLAGGIFKATSEFVELLIGSIGRQALPQFGTALALESEHPLVAFIIKTFPVATASRECVPVNSWSSDVQDSPHPQGKAGFEAKDAEEGAPPGCRRILARPGVTPRPSKGPRSSSQFLRRNDLHSLRSYCDLPRDPRSHLPALESRPERRFVFQHHDLTVIDQVADSYPPHERQRLCLRMADAVGDSGSLADGERVLVRGAPGPSPASPRLPAATRCASRAPGRDPPATSVTAAPLRSPARACTVLRRSASSGRAGGSTRCGGRRGRAPRRRVEPDGPERHRDPAVSAGTRAGDDCPGRSAPDDCGRRRPREDDPGGDRPRPSAPSSGNRSARSSSHPRAPRAVVARACRSFQPGRDGRRRGMARASSRELPPDVNPWILPGIYVTSFDFVKQPEVLRPLEEADWDVLVVDEAHGAALGTARRAAVHAIAHPIEARAAADGDAARGRPEPVRGLVPHRRNSRATAIG